MNITYNVVVYRIPNEKNVYFIMKKYMLLIINNVVTYSRNSEVINLNLNVRIDKTVHPINNYLSNRA